MNYGSNFGNDKYYQRSNIQRVSVTRNGTIAQDLSKRYYHNELTYRDLENLEKQFDIRAENLISEIFFVEKNL